MTFKSYNVAMQFLDRKFVIFMLFTISHEALAIATVPCKTPKFSHLKDLVKKISVIGSEDRKTFEEYASERGLSTQNVEKKFAASGLLNCGDKGAVSAQLTGSSSVITTASHFFLDKKSGGRCKEAIAEKCSFYVYKDGWTIEYPVDMSSLRMSGCGVDDKKSDWAVLKLNKSVKNVRPYDIPSNSAKPRVDDKLINPAAFATNFKKQGQLVRSITDCSVRDFDPHLKTDCDSGEGASGSAQLIEENGKLVQVAILTGSMAREDGESYDESFGYTTSSVLEGDFYEAVREAIGKPARTASAKDKNDKGI